MKKIYVMLLILLGFSFLTSCQLDKDILLGNKEPHEHVLVPEWTQNDKYHWHACSGCDKMVEKEAHDFGSWVEVKEATEYEAGEEKRECICGFTETRVIERLDHTHKPTGEYGHNDKYHWETCSECDAQLNKKSHTGGVATCQEKATCSICNVQYGSLSNKHVYGEYVVISEATCKERAIEEARCTVDGCQAKDTRYVPGSTIASHKWGEWTYIEGSATCLKDGMEERGCLTCSSKEKRSAEGTKLAHHASSEVLFDGNSHWNSCDVTKGCTEKLNVVAHSFDDDCDEVCNGCTYKRQGHHTYDNACDKVCNICNAERYTPDHTGGTATCLLPAICSECGVPYGLPLEHTYHNACDATCNMCGLVTRVPAPHKGGTATCEEKAICSECGLPYGELASHRFGTWVPEVAATCEETGTKGHQYCSVCKKNYDEHGNIIVNLTIAATGHKLGSLNAKVDPTCTEVGKKAHYECLACHTYFDETKENKLTDLIITEVGHDLKYNALVPADCENSGIVAHYHCNTCGKDYEDSEATKELATIIISAKGHNYGEWIPAKSETCEENGNLGHFDCSECDKYFDINREELEEVIIPATQHDWSTELSGKDADKHGYQCNNCGEFDPERLTEHKNFNVAEPTIDTAKRCEDCGYTVSPALNHTEHTGGTATCTSKAICTGCGEEYGDLNPNNHSSDECSYVLLDATSHKKIYTCCNIAVTEEHDVIQEATCITQAICSNCGLFGDLKNHTYDEEHKVLTASTCLEDGYITYTCTTNGCDNTKVVAGDAAPGHTIVVDDAIEATCTSIGLTEGSHCSVCSEVLVKQVVIPMKQHSVGETGTKATCLYPAICGLCNQYFDDKDTSNHVNELSYKDNGDGTHTAIYTCCDTSVENGTSMHTGGTQSCHSLMSCTSCGALYGELLLHNYKGITSNPSISTTGLVTYACSNDGCKEKFEIILPLIGEKYSEDVLIGEKLEYQYKLKVETINLLVANLSVKDDLAEYLEGLTFTYLPVDVNKSGYFMVVDGVLVENANEFTADLAVDNNVVIYDANGSKLQYNLVDSNESNDSNTINVYINLNWENIETVYVNDVQAEICYSPYGNYVAKLSEASSKLDVDFKQGSAWFHIETKDSSRGNNPNCYIDYQLELGKNYQITDINYKYQTNSSQKFFYATIDDVENYRTNSYSIRENGEHKFTVNSNNQIDVTAPTITIYLNTGGSSLWNQANAWFAAWVYPNPVDKLWVKLVKTSKEGIYSAVIPSTTTNIRFFRMSNSGTEFTWMQNGTGWWNQTTDLEIAGNNKIYKITGWGSADGNWSDYHICVSNGVYDFDENLHWTNCSICGNEMNEIAHTNEATCTDGYTCDCGKVFAELGHNEQVKYLDANGDEIIQSTSISCNQKVLKVTYCVNGCGSENSVSIEGKDLLGSGLAVVEHSSPVDATCKAAGYCDYCKNTIAPQDPNKHKGEYVPNDDATCTTNGTQTRVCELCGDTDTIEVADSKLEHDFSEWNVEIEPTPTNDGIAIRKCERTGCEVKETLIIKALVEGNYNAASVIVVPATCTLAGSETYTIKDLKDNLIATYTVNLPELGHNWSDWEKEVVEGSETGNLIRECLRDNCDEIERKTNAHICEYVYTLVTDPTVDSNGSIKKSCTVEDCGNVSVIVIPALEKEVYKANVTENLILKFATTVDCLNSGEETYQILVGNITYTYLVNTNAYGHSLSDYLQAEDKHYKECMREGCDYATEAVACSGGEATCVAKALCSTCGNEYGEKDSANHLLSENYLQAEDKHYKECMREGCDHTTDAVACTGGTATCTTYANCSECGFSYGTLTECIPSSIWSSNDKNHWKICVSDVKCTKTFESSAHNSEGKDGLNAGGNNRYYKYCSVCNKQTDSNKYITLYLSPNSNWKKDNARFAVYTWNDSGNTWINMTDDNGDGIYEVEINVNKYPSNIIFCRMNPNSTTNNWDNKWNQTNNLTIPTNKTNKYTVAAGVWSNGSGSWSAHEYNGDDTYYLLGDVNEWSITNAANYLLNTNPLDENQMVLYDIELPEGEFKIVEATEGVWYGDSNSNNITVSRGRYSIYFDKSTSKITVYPSVLYLQPNSNWSQGGKRFAAYFFEGDNEQWESMTDSDGDGIYECLVPVGYTNVIFCSMVSGINNWSECLYQTNDLVVPTDGTNKYYVGYDTYNKPNGSWSTYTPSA